MSGSPDLSEVHTTATVEQLENLKENGRVIPVEALLKIEELDTSGLVSSVLLAVEKYRDAGQDCVVIEDGYAFFVLPSVASDCT